MRSEPGPAPGSPADPLNELIRRTEGPQLGRRLFHAGAGLLLAGVLHWHVAEADRLLAAAVLGVLAVLLLLADLARLRIPLLNRAFFVIFRPLASPREAANLASSTWYAVGCALTVALFPLAMAVPAILVLALADPVASYLGRRWGRRPLGKGSVEGSALFLLVAVVLLLAFVPPMSAVVAALVGTWVERTPWSVDDNLSVPLAIGGVLWLMARGFG